MNNLDILEQRLSNQHLVGNPMETAADLVAYFGAVQAQDYFGSKWAVGQRVQEVDEAAVKKAFQDGEILRTHIMRPTWHYVTPADIRWIQTLTAPRVNAASAYMYRQVELDEAVFVRTNDTIAKALEGGQFKTRPEIGDLLEKAGINASGMRLGYVLMRAEIDAIICSGPRRGKQFTYALLDERAPNAKSLPHDEALAELTRRYFTSHGPAALEDFVFWSGLTKTQARQGLALNDGVLIRETVGDHTYWLAPDLPQFPTAYPTAHFLPNYDEYLISYRTSGPFMDPAHDIYIEKQNSYFTHFLIVDGRLLGTWRRDFEKDTLILTIRHFTTLTEPQETAVHTAGEAFGKFLGLNVKFRAASPNRP